VVHSSLYLPEAVYEALRESAFRERCKIHDLVMQGIEMALKKRGYPPVEELKAGKKRWALALFERSTDGACVDRFLVRGGIFSWSLSHYSAFWNLRVTYCGETSQIVHLLKKKACGINAGRRTLTPLI
jgi:hypothetical protein